MTPDELLKPRYKVIADYFHSPYKVGDIITLPENNRSVHLTTIHYNDEFGERIGVQQHYAPKTIDQYPHLFKLLQWWEERKPEEMPEYIKCIKTPDQIIIPGEVLKVNWSETGGKVQNGPWVFPYTNCYLPATEQEYIEYIKQKDE